MTTAVGDRHAVESQARASSSREPTHRSSLVRSARDGAGRVTAAVDAWADVSVRRQAYGRGPVPTFSVTSAPSVPGGVDERRAA